MGQENHEDGNKISSNNSNICCCDFCGEAIAVLYCRADDAKLCLLCDRHVHSANTVSSRHSRSLLCSSCRSAPAAFINYSSSNTLCSNCDFDSNKNESNKLDRRPVEPFSGCPTSSELVSLLFGVAGDEKGDWVVGADENFEGVCRFWETKQVLSWDDLIVPTTHDHGFQALGTLSYPKQKQRFLLNPNNEEIIRQLRELMNAENPESNGNSEVEQLVDFQSLVAGPGEEPKSDLYCNTSCVDLPIFEDSTFQWNVNDYHEVTVPAGYPYEQYTESIYAVNTSPPDEFVGVQGIESLSSDGTKVSDQTTTNDQTWLLPSGGAQEFISAADRNTVISRYKEKRKTRRYDKVVRYESRKARADSRARINGRFAKIGEVPEP